MSCSDHSGPIDYAVEREHFDGEATPQIRANPPRMPKDDAPSIADEIIGYACTVKYVNERIAELIKDIAFYRRSDNISDVLDKLANCYADLSNTIWEINRVSDDWYKSEAAKEPKVHRPKEERIGAEALGFVHTLKRISNLIVEAIMNIAIHREKYYYRDVLEKLTKCYGVMFGLVSDMQGVANRWKDNNS